MNQKFNTFFLDLDGTLTDPKVGITKSYQYALQKMGLAEIPSEQDLLWTIGPPIQVIFAKLISSDDPVLINQAIGYFRERFGTIGLFENEVYPHIAEVMGRLKKKGCRLYVVTAKAQPFAQRILEHFNLDGYYEAVYGSLFDGSYTDKGQLIEHILNTTPIRAADTIMVGDRMHDMIAAHKNGLACAGVTYGYGSLEELKGAGADFLLDAPEELLNLAWER